MSSLTWTRTKNLPINSRLLCQLSYQGLSRPLGAREGILARSGDLAKSGLLQIPYRELFLSPSLRLFCHQGSKYLVISLALFDRVDPLQG